VGKGVTFLPDWKLTVNVPFPQKLLLMRWSDRSSQCFQPRYRPRRKNIPNLRDIITHELERLMIVLPQGTGNIETFLHGDIGVLFSIREGVQRCLLKAIERAINSGVTTSTAPLEVYHPLTMLTLAWTSRIPKDLTLLDPRGGKVSSRDHLL
jgi:hypothetical protein